MKDTSWPAFAQQTEEMFLFKSKRKTKMLKKKKKSCGVIKKALAAAFYFPSRLGLPLCVFFSIILFCHKIKGDLVICLVKLGAVLL